MVWFKKLGFDENPLDLRPNTNLVGLEEQEDQLKNHILKEEICFLNGLTGAGKTSLLKRIQKTMEGHTFIYLDAQDLPYNFNLEKAIKDRKNFFDKIAFRDYPKKIPVLIIDEFQETDKNLILEARGKWEDKDNQRIKSIIVCQIRKNLRNVTPAFKERLGSRTITLKTLDDDEMKDILKLRLNCPKKKINYLNKLEDEATNLLVECADGNPRRLLEYTDLLFDFHHRKFSKINPLTKDNYKITYWGAKEILSLNNVNVNFYEEKKKEENQRNVDAFEDKFGNEEQKILKFFMTGAKTVNELAEFFSLSEKRSHQWIRELKAKNAIVGAGKKDRKKLWQTAQHIKRMSVNE